MIILDASVLIAHFDGSNIHHARADELLIDAGSQTLGASAITLAEVLVKPARIGQLQAATAALEKLDIQTVELGADAAVRLATLRAETRLKLPDCCVLLAAEHTGSRVASFDERLSAAAAERIGVFPDDGS